jgi:hypothetical protein
MSVAPLGASFRDPSGFVFERDGLIYRQVNRSYAEDYDLFCSSGLYEKLSSAGMLVAHEEVAPPVSPSDLHYKTLLPEQLDFISYPYEWSFSALRDAALLTLRIQRLAMASGMSLKDASVYNVQFQRGRPVFIDTLSFERYREGEPWVGYRQFCQHFLAPLALMALRDVRLLQLMKVHIDGIPLDLAASLLPARAWRRIGLLMHLRFHARSQKRHEAAGADAASDTSAASEAVARKRKLSKDQLVNITRSLGSAIEKLSWLPEGTEWADYYEGDSYEAAALERKKGLVSAYLAEIAPQTVWDLGSNTGVYSRLAAEAGARVVAFDVDPACVERSYRQLRETKEDGLLPLLLDLTNPSPAIGWANDERVTIGQRGRPDVVLALALIHHIAISNNVPLHDVASHFADLSDQLIIEFVPKSDAKVRTLLATREDVFPRYTREGFEDAFRTRFDILAATDIEGSDRTLYRMKRRAV